MKIRAYSDLPKAGRGSYCFPLGSVDNSHVYIGSITLDRKGDGGQISEPQARNILAEAIMHGAEIKIKFDNVEIILNGL